MAIEIERLDDPGQPEHVAPGVFDKAINASYLAAFLSCPRHIMFVAVDAGNVIGVVSGVEYFHPDKPAQMWVNEVGVAPSHQRRGIGRKLIGAIVDAAEARGCICAWLGMAEDNKPAQACFAAVPEGEPRSHSFCMNGIWRTRSTFGYWSNRRRDPQNSNVSSCALCRPKNQLVSFPQF